MQMKRVHWRRQANSPSCCPSFDDYLPKFDEQWRHYIRYLVEKDDIAIRPVLFSSM